ncbi:MAG: macro domain-containing protein [Thermogutta sp.]|nr:MAG: macro domain-containing protein [Thermogutta sp.]
MAAKCEIGNCLLELVEGDITEQHVDAIVNAANSRLAGGGGVDGAIHRKGGPEIMAETKAKYPQGCPTGSAVVSGAGRLPAKFVIHAVGPIYRDGQHGEPELLASAYRRSLALAVEHDCRSVAFPALSAGAYGYPLAEAARVALSTVTDFLKNHGKPELVRFVLFGKPAYETFVKVLQDIAGSDRVVVESE